MIVPGLVRDDDLLGVLEGRGHVGFEESNRIVDLWRSSRLWPCLRAPAFQCQRNMHRIT